MTRTAYSYARFSSAEQEKGDSEDRQTKDAKAYADANDFVLEPLGVDRGISAYHGKNISEGVIGDFIKRVEAGEIPAGCVLLLESPDRFSRQLFSDCWPHFQKILNGGIEIHFLFVKKVLKPNHSFIDLLQIGVEIDRGNSESANKSARVGKAWKKKKANAGNGLALTSVVPAWLQAVKGQRPVIVPQRAATVKKIFRLAALGLGAYRITAQLTADGDKPFGEGGWTLPYIKKILKNRAVLGEFQPKKRVNEQRAIDGESIMGFFPPVVTQMEWDAARASVVARTHNYSKRGYAVCGGRVGNGTNLFSGLLVDASLAGRPMSFRGKSGRTKSDYLVTAYKAGKPQHSMRYDTFERGFLGFLSELDWRSIAGQTESVEFHAAQAGLNKVLGELDRVQRRMTATNTAMEADDIDAATLTVLATRLAKDEAQLANLVAQRDALQVNVDVVKTRCEALYTPETLLALILSRTPETNDVRLRLRNEIRRRVEKIGINFSKTGSITATIVFVNGARKAVIFKGDSITLAYQHDYVRPEIVPAA